MQSLHTNELFLLAQELSLPDLFNFCATNRKFRHTICEKDDIWRYKTRIEFPNVNIERDIGYMLLDLKLSSRERYFLLKALSMPLQELTNFCKSTGVVTSFCQRDDLWRYRLYREFPDITLNLIPIPSPRDLYILLHSLNELKEQHFLRDRTLYQIYDGLRLSKQLKSDLEKIQSKYYSQHEQIFTPYYPNYENPFRN